MLAVFDWHVLWQQIFHPDSEFWHALWLTVFIAVVAQILGVVLGLVAALMRMSKHWLPRALSNLYTLVFRGTPVIVQIFFVYYGVNLLFGITLIPNTLHLGLFDLQGTVLAGMLALGINEGAYMREIIRAGIDAIDRGQMEAARSLGMTYGLGMRRIVLPQSARVIVPPLGNEFNNMLKTTSLISFIGVTELFQYGQIQISNTFKYPEYLTAVAFWYLVLTSIWSLVQARIEQRLGVSDRSDADRTLGERVAGRLQAGLAWRDR